MGEGEIYRHPEPQLPGKIKGRENGFAMGLHHGTHLFYVGFGHLVLLYAGQIGHESTMLFLSGIFRAAQGVFAFPNQLAT